MALRRLMKSNFSANEQEEPTPVPPHSLNEIELIGTDRNITLFIAAPNITVLGMFTTATAKRGTWLWYSQPNYMGSPNLVNSAARSQAEASITQNALQSVRPLMGEIILYANLNYTGTSLVLTESAPNLGPFNFNYKASSARVVSGKWQLYQGTNYQGTSHTTSGNPEALSPIPGIPNNSLSSVKFIPEA